MKNVIWVVLVSSVALAGTEARVRSVKATLGAADALFDGNPATGWELAADVAEDEGVSVRFVEPVELSEVQVTPCLKSEAPTLELVVNGARHLTFSSRKEALVASAVGQAQTLFVHVERAKAAVCLGEVRLMKNGQLVAVVQPKRVKATIEATSTLTPAEAYHPSYAFDGRVDSGWVEGVKSAGEGERLTVKFAQPQTLKGFDFWNGYQRSPDHFAKNARALELEVAVGEAKVEFDVQDTMGSQHFTFDPPLTGASISFTVKKAKKGKVYADLVMSEIQLESLDGLLELDTPDAEQLRAALLASLGGKPLAAFVDVKHRYTCRTSWLSHEVALKFRSDHSFVVYVDDSETSDSAVGWDRATRQEVFDGRWVVKSQGPWTALQLFGRRHAVSSATEAGPYQDSTKTSTREAVGGGTIELAAVKDVGPDEAQAFVNSWRDAAGARCLQQSKAVEAMTHHAKAFLIRGPPLMEVVE